MLKAGGRANASTSCASTSTTPAPARSHPYHEVRREFFAGHVPPSTSNLHQRFLLAGQDIEVQLMAVLAGSGFEPEQHRPATLPVHASSGYSPVLTCGDYVFVAGQTAEALKTEEGPLDPEARMPAGHLWKGTPIKLETEFVLERKLKPALETVGNTLEDVVKAQVYLRDIDDIPAFNEVWAKHFAANPPATTIITTSDPGFHLRSRPHRDQHHQRAQGRHHEKESIDADVPMPYAGQVQAVRAGDLLFLSGLMAVDARGALAVARDDPRAADGAAARCSPSASAARPAPRSRTWCACSSSTPAGGFQRRLAGVGAASAGGGLCLSRRSRCRRSACRARW